MGINREYIKQLLMQENAYTLELKIDLSNQGLLDSDIEELVELLKQYPDKKIKFLNLYGNNITDKGAIKLAELKDLIEINLSHNSIGDEGAKALVPSPVKKLDLSNNSITDESSDFIEENTKQTVLILNQNSLSPISMAMINAKVKKNNVTTIPSIENTSAKGIRFMSPLPEARTQEKETYLDQYSEENPFTILLVGENLSDGIGDFVHLYDFYNYLKEKYEGEKRVKIQCLSFIDDDKLNIINNVYGENFKITENQPISDKNQSDIIFFRRKDNKHANEFSEKNKNVNLLFYVSIYKELKAIIPQSNIYLGEYEASTFDAPTPCDIIDNDIWKFKRSMGIGPDRAGIKIIRPIINARKALEQQQDQTPNYENRYFRTLFAKKEDTFLAAGYLQSRIQSDMFIMNSLALAGNKSTINIVTNHEGINKNSKGLFSNDKLNHYIESFNLSRIEVVTSQGEILFEKNIENTGSKKVLRIIQFKNIEEQDKYILYASADSVGGSGDTSCSELISAMAFPYIAKKQEFVRQLKAQSTEMGLTDLSTYLELLDRMIDIERIEYFKECLKDKNFDRLEGSLLEVYEMNQIKEFIQENDMKIRSQWNILCEWIIKNKDVFDFTDHLIDRAMKHSSEQLISVKKTSSSLY